MPNLKQSAMEIFRRTLTAIDIPVSMQRKLCRAGSEIIVSGVDYDLAAYEKILVVAIGKASVAMAHGITETLAPNFCAEGIVVAPTAVPNSPGGFRTIVGGHPIPNEGSFVAGKAILDLLARATEKTLVFFLLSGGGSALVELPLDPAITLNDFQALNRKLVTCGASIDEINAVRKHLSAVKGGRMAVASGSATKITLGVTDVPEGQESALASGPTLPDPTTVADACSVVTRYDLLSRLPPGIRKCFEAPEFIAETPKAHNPAFDVRRSVFQIVLGRHELFHAAHHCSESLEFVTICDNATDNWPVGKAVDFLLDQLLALKQSNPHKSVAVIADGEVSSPVTGDGIGGRNLAFVLNAVSKIAGRTIAVLSAGTDGIDGSSPAAGAVADGETLTRARVLGLDPAEYFRRSDSYTFFQKLDDAIETGATGNNLRDLRIFLME
jgi:glycerate 2-kinase